MKFLKRLTTSNHSSKSKKKTELKPEDYERIGRQLVNVYETGFINDRKFYKMSLIRGILTGLGATIGATIVLSIVIWILSSLPIVRDLTQGIRTDIEQSQNTE